jgi:hypothetical protein
MYLRFVSPIGADRRRGQYGLFTPAFDVEHHCTTPEAISRAVRAELDWFNANLPAPKGRHFRVKSCKRWYSEGICWFRDDAREMIAHANVLAGLLDECGLAIVRLHTRHPGQILYRDAYQIVAKPAAVTPVTWH